MAVNPIASKYCCVTIQQMLDDIVGDANALQNVVPETYGFMDALMSTPNTAGFEQVQTESAIGKARPVTGGNRRVELAYPVRQCNTVTAAAANVCDTPAVAGDDFLYSEVTVECVQSTGFTLNREEFRQLCEEPNDRLQRLIVNRINDLKKAINADLISKYIAELGDYFVEEGDPAINSGVAPKTLLLFNNLYQPNALGFTPLQRNFHRAGFSNNPMIVGGTTLRNWVQPVTRSVFSENQEGRNNSNVAVPNSFIDYQVDTTFADGDEHLLTWVPGFAQMLNWYQYEGIYETMTDTFQRVKMSMGDFTFDFTWKYDECNDTYVYTMTKYYDLFCVPDEAYNINCNQSIGGGKIQYLVDCGDLDCNYGKL